MHATPQKNPFLDATGGNLKITFGYGNPVVYVVFGKNASEAKKLHDKAIAQTLRYQAIEKQVIIDGVGKKANVFYYSDAGPVTLYARGKLEACLR